MEDFMIACLWLFWIMKFEDFLMQASEEKQTREQLEEEVSENEFQFFGIELIHFSSPLFNFAGGGIAAWIKWGAATEQSFELCIVWVNSLLFMRLFVATTKGNKCF